MTNDVIDFWKEGLIPTMTLNENCGKTVYWQPMDTLENFQKNRPKGYTETSITYSYNQYGFRTKEFDLASSKDKILCLGCSHTEGIGVQDPWPTYLQEYFPDADVYNLGHGGGSYDTITRILSNIAGLVRPRLVCIFGTQLTRFETYGPAGPDQLRNNGSWNMLLGLTDYYDDYNLQSQFQKNMLIVDLLSTKYGFEYILYKQQEFYGHAVKDPKLFEPSARDCTHYGPYTHKFVAKEFFDRYTKRQG